MTTGLAGTSVVPCAKVFPGAIATISPRGLRFTDTTARRSPTKCLPAVTLDPIPSAGAAWAGTCANVLAQFAGPHEYRGMDAVAGGDERRERAAVARGLERVLGLR